MNHSKRTMHEGEIRARIGDYRSPILDTLCELISIPTVNPPGEFYRECVDYVSRKLKEWKFDHSIMVGPLRDYPRYSILGEYGKGVDSLHFHGHYDVVPAHSSDQFKPDLQGGRLYGRGSSDMKSGLVALLFALRIIKECRIKLKGKITFSIVPDEETGGDYGTKHLVDSGLLPRVNLGILMPEPTSGVIWNANKGALTYRVTVEGRPAHVGLEDQGDNAFERMVEVVQSLIKLKKEIKKRKTRMAIHPLEANRSVMLVGGESGSGFSFNLVPERAFFTIDRRINPEESLDEARRELTEVLNEHKKKGVKIEMELLQGGEPSTASQETPLASALRESVALVTEKIPRFELCPGLCEIRFFNKRGIPAYAYGPGLLEVSHGPQEYVNISDVLNCIEVYALTALRLLS